MAFDEGKFARYGLLAGVAAAVLIAASAFLAGGAPLVSDGDGEILEYLTDKQDTLKIASYLGGLAGVAWLWFLGSLYGRLRTAEGDTGRLSRVAMMAGVAGIAIAFAGNAINASAVLRPNPGLWRIGVQFYGYTGFFIAVFVAAISVLLWSRGLLPKWFGYAGEAIALLFFVGSANVATENDTIALVGYGAFVLWLLWVIGLSVQLYRSEA